LTELFLSPDDEQEYYYSDSRRIGLHEVISDPLSAVAALTAASALAGTVTSINTNNPPDSPIIGITGFGTFGDMMAGIQIQANFSDNTSAVCTWAATGLGAGGCLSGGNFSIGESGDTFSGVWTLTNLRTVESLTSIFIDALVGGTVFDRTNPPPGTPGSAGGKDVVSTNGVSEGLPWSSAATALALYQNRIAIIGDTNSPYGDLYGRLDLIFSGEAVSGGGIAPGGVATFVADTDSVIQGAANTPEPATLTLLGAGFAGLAFLRRKK
jgi:hypothetical protein